ncbi:hypothetical protein L6R53_29690 [Myxococcota bacterium]|nr:hypothetical protein [Myxococcota bacterium]
MSLTIYDDIRDLPTTRYGDYAIRSCRYWKPTAVAIEPGASTGGESHLFVGGEHDKDQDETGHEVELAYSGDVLQLSLSMESSGVVLESDHLTADLRADHCGDLFGYTFVDVVDIDGDGVSELVAGSQAGRERSSLGLCEKNWPPDYNVGAWVVPGPFSGDVIAEEVGWFAGYPWDEISFWNGIPVVVGDVTGDGVMDLALPLAGDSLGVPGAGEVALLPGPFEPGEHVDLSEHDFVFQGGSHSHSMMPTVMGEYDADGDGFVDLAMSHCGEGDFPGVSIYLGPLTSGSMGADADVEVGMVRLPCREEVTWWDSDGHWGQPILNGGDMNGDGRDELVVAAYDQNLASELNAGVVWVVESELRGGLSDIDRVASARIEGHGDQSFAGKPVSGGGDLDGDGRTDLVVGSPFTSTWSPDKPLNPDPGTWLHYGPLAGRISVDAGVVVHANRTGLMASDGDLDGDGIDDLVMSDERMYADDWDVDDFMMGAAVHVWLSGQSLEFPRPWAPTDE